jgi:hypothetical protein
METAGRADGALPDDLSLHPASDFGGFIRTFKRFNL